MQLNEYKLILKAREFNNPETLSLFYKFVNIGLQEKRIDKDSQAYSITVRQNKNDGISFNILRRLIISLYVRSDKDIIGVYMDMDRAKAFADHSAIIDLPTKSFTNTNHSVVKFDASNLLESDDSLIIAEFKKALSEYDVDPNRSSPYHIHTMPSLYDIVSDTTRQRDIRSYIEARNPIELLIENICNEDERIQQICDSTEFYYAKAREHLTTIKQTKFDLEKLVDFSLEYKEQKLPYFKFVSEMKDSMVKNHAILLGKLITHIDSKASGKTDWNKTEGVRTIAQAGVYQGDWLKHLIIYIKNDYDPASITANSIRHAINFLDRPNEGMTMLSGSHRESLSQFLFDKPYIIAEEFEFARSVNDYFNKIELILANEENRMVAISAGLYHIMSIWNENDIDENWLKVFDQMITEYKQVLLTDTYQEKYKWDCIEEFTKVFDMEAEDFGSNFMNATKKHFNLIHHFSYAYLKDVSTHFPDQLRESLKILYNEKSKLETRIDKYSAFHDELLPSLKQKINKESYKHQQSERAISALLSFKYPENYCFYQPTIYVQLCKQLRIRPKKKVGQKYPHYLELLSGLSNKVREDHELIQLVEKTHNTHYDWDQGVLIAQDIIYKTIKESIDDGISATEESSEHKRKTMKRDHTLNTILYGPPGTGKTYHTINHALSIIEGKSYQDLVAEERTVLHGRFQEYLNSGRIVFTTFHQSMSYEDFVEGIKPQEPKEDGDPVIYKIEDGIFKRLTINAAFSSLKSKDDISSKLSSYNAKYDQMLDAISETVGDFSFKLKSGAEIIVDSVSEKDNLIVRHKNGTGKYRVSRNRLERVYNKLPYEEVNNINQAIRNIIGGSNASAYWAVNNYLRNITENEKLSDIQINYSYDDIKSALSDIDLADLSTNAADKFVLIIDEVNRGNVSSIFGELITLLEEDKRIGNTEQIQVTLPYSKEKFYVPSNLYVIGTMNTADRSVEALDSALRRRFSFIEMPANPEVLKQTDNQFIDDIDLVKLLTAINTRLEKLLDKDHSIGHSYFMGLKTRKDLIQVFQDKVIPLLEEYFFGDLGKLGLILGSTFIKAVDQKAGVAFKNFEGLEQDYIGDLEDKKIFHITLSSSWNVNDIYEG